MHKPKVLMLGWEFPPVINGGLGVACLGLAKAMSSSTDLKMILPKTDPSFIVDNVDLIGLNNIDLEQIVVETTEKEKYSQFADTYYADINLAPYTVEKISSTNTRTVVETEKGEFINYLKEKSNIFKEDNLYGENVIEKVILYSKYVLKLSENLDFDIIHAHDWMTFLAGVELKFKTGKPLVLHAHSLDYDRAGPESRGWIYDLEKYAMQNADKIIPVSHYTGSIITGHYGIDPNKVRPIHNGVEKVNAFRDEKKFPEKLVLFLGRVTEQKGPEFFLETAAKVFQSYPKVRFVMAGTGDKLKRLIEDGAYRLVGHKFHFTGFLTKDKVQHLLSIADVYCMPSKSEPFGLSALEAAQFEIPLVISKQSGAAEVMTGALKADYWDVNVFAENIIKLLKSKKFADKVVEQGMKDLEALSWEHASDKIMEVYKEVSP